MARNRMVVSWLLLQAVPQTRGIIHKAPKEILKPDFQLINNYTLIKRCMLMKSFIEVVIVKIEKFVFEFST